jgi:hypothetical protein
MKGVLSWLVRWACRTGTRDFFLDWLLIVGPEQTIFFLTVHYLYTFVPFAKQPRQAAVLSRLSLSVYLWHILILLTVMVVLHGDGCTDWNS